MTKRLIKLINFSLLVLGVMTIIITIYLSISYAGFIAILEKVNGQEQISNPPRVLYSMYVAFIALAQILLLVKHIVKRNEDRKDIFGISTLVLLVIILSILVILFDIFLPESMSEQIFREDGLFENLTAIFSMGAAILLLAANLKRRPIIAKLFLFSFSGLLFFFAMEEISWGQRIFGWKTPKAMMDINVQEETNFHNIFNQYFEIFYLIFFPVLCLFLFTRASILRIIQKFPKFHGLIPIIPSPSFYYLGFIFLFLFPYTLLFDKGGETLEFIFSLFLITYAFDVYKGPKGLKR